MPETTVAALNRVKPDIESLREAVDKALAAPEGRRYVISTAIAYAEKITTDLERAERIDAGGIAR